MSDSESFSVDLDLDLDLPVDIDTENQQSVVDSSTISTSSASVNTSTRTTSNSPIRKRARYSSDSDQETDSNGSPDGTSMTTPSTAEAGGRTNDPDGSRRQSHSAMSAASMSEQMWETKKKLKRDDQYYMEDGSCVLLVEDTLFNVHRTILSKDCSSFSTMFTLPQGDHQKEGISDENPIILTGDTPTEFKHFLWSLYALPLELQTVYATLAPLTELIDIARISNKYSFKSQEKWSLDAIQVYVNRKPSPILAAIPGIGYNFSQATIGIQSNPNAAATASAITIPAHPPTTALLTRLIRLAQMCSHDHLLATMIALLRQLMSQSVQYAYLAMVLSDELNLRSLRGVAYMEVMQKPVVVKRAERNSAGRNGEGGGDDDGEVEGEIDKKGRLVVSRAQHLRLLSGYHRLTSTWEQLRASPPQFEHAASCGATWHKHGCTQSWLEFWKEKTRSDRVLGLGLADVLGRLRAVGTEYEKWGSAAYLHHDCRMAVRRCLQEKIMTIEEDLPGFFEDGG